MADSRINGKKPSRKADAAFTDATLVDATLAFKKVEVLLDSFLTDGSESTLTALKRGLADCIFLRNDAGIILENFVKNLRGAKTLTIGDVKPILGRTRSSLFIFTEKPPESFSEIKGLVGVDFTNNSLAETKKTQKRFFIILITLTDLEKIRAVAAREKSVIEKPTLEPVEGEMVNIDEFRGKLRECNVISSTVEDFDMRRFADEVKFVETFQDEKNRYYFIIAGDAENRYRLYVNVPGMITTKMQSYPRHAAFKYKSDLGMLCWED